MEIVIVIIAIICIIALVFFIQYNSLVKLKMKVKQSKSGIDIYCQQRFDLIPNLIETVKGYMEYEKQVFENITQLRAQFTNTKDLKVGEELNKQINNIIAVAENYPDLKVNEQFLNLQKNLEKTESQLQAARRIYNNDVTNYNIKISIIPYNIIAKLFGFSSETLFQLEDNSATENVKVSFKGL